MLFLSFSFPHTLHLTTVILESAKADFACVDANSIRPFKLMNELKIELPPNISTDEARLLLTLKLFETGKISLGQAAKLAGYSKRTFIELLGKMGVPVINYPSEELEREINL